MEDHDHDDTSTDIHSAPPPSSETLQYYNASAQQLLHQEAKYDVQQNLISGSSLWQNQVSAVMFSSNFPFPTLHRPGVLGKFCKLHDLLELTNMTINEVSSFSPQAV